MHKSKNVFISQLTPNSFGGLPGYYLSARESLFSVEMQDKVGSSRQFFMTVVGPEGLRDKLSTASPFMGMMPYLRAVETSAADVAKEK